MSQQPPPPPYGGPPQPPYGGPPNPYGPGQYPPPEGQRPGMSNKSAFWIGVVLALPALFVVSLVLGVGAAVGEGLVGDPAVGGVISALLGVGLLAGLVTAIVVPKTRWFALGVLAGAAILLIVAAGACVVLLIALTQSYS